MPSEYNGPKVAEAPDTATVANSVSSITTIPVNTTSIRGIDSASLSAAEMSRLKNETKYVDTTTIQGVSRASVPVQSTFVNTNSISGIDAASNKSTATTAEINESSTIPEYVVTPNLLHDYASYTYNISLHALTPKDYTYIMENPGEDYKPTAVLIASGGRWSNQNRHQEFRDVDFFFDNLSLETIIGMSAQTRNTNAVTTSFTIIEPYGVTLLNRIMNVCTNIGGQNFREMPYMLQIDFFGYTDAGIPTKIPELTKMIPIRFMEFKIKLSTKGAEYAVTAYAFNHTAYSETIASTPTKLEVVAATVGDFFLAKTGIPDEYKNEDTKTISDRTSKNARLEAANREVAAMEKVRQENTVDSFGIRIPPAKSDKQIAVENEVNVLSKEVVGALKVHSYTGAVNAWYTALKNDKKIEYPHVIMFEIDEEIANATFPEAQYLPPAMSPMAATDTDTDKTIIEVAKSSAVPSNAGTVNTTTIAGISSASSNDIQDRTDSIRVAPSFNNTANERVKVTNTTTLEGVTNASTYSAEQKAKIVDLASSKDQNTQNGLYTKIYSGSTQTRIISINQGTSIIEVIGLAIRASSYITKQLVDPVSLTASPQQLADLNNKALNWFKITPRVELLEYDKSQNTFAKKITYKIEKYVVYNTKNQLAPQGLPRGYVKEYQYMYTGHNKDVIGLDINFDSLYYVAQTTAAINKDAISAAPNTATDRDAVPGEAEVTKAEASQVATSKANKGMLVTKTNINTTTGVASATNKDDPSMQTQQQLLTSPSGDMLSIKLKIIGDPDFIKQDDCFYSTPTLQKAKENEFKLRKGGSLVMDLGEVFVNLIFKTPGDYDSTGLARPGYEKYNSSIFSGRYKVLTVKSTFSGGKFEQELDLIYFPNQETQGVDSVPQLPAKNERETINALSDTRVDNMLSGNKTSASSTLLGTNRVSEASDETLSDNRIVSQYDENNIDSTVDTILKEATARRIAATTFPTFSLGSDYLQDQMATVRANAATAASEAATGFSKIPLNTLSKSTLSPAASNLSTVLTSAQSSTATATSSATLTPALQTGTGGRF